MAGRVVWVASDGREFDSKENGDRYETYLQCLKQGDILYNKGNYESAINLYTEAMKYFGGNDGTQMAKLLRGQAYFHLKKYSSAISDFRSALQLYRYYPDLHDRNLGILYNLLGVAYMEQGNRDNAVEAYKNGADVGDKTCLENLTNMGIKYKPYHPDARRRDAERSRARKEKTVLAICVFIGIVAGFYFFGSLQGIIGAISGIVIGVFAGRTVGLIINWGIADWFDYTKGDSGILAFLASPIAGAIIFSMTGLGLSVIIMGAVIGLMFVKRGVFTATVVGLIVIAVVLYFGAPKINSVISLDIPSITDIFKDSSAVKEIPDELEELNNSFE